MSFLGPEKRGDETSKVHEMWRNSRYTRCQENAQDQKLLLEVLENGESVNWEVMRWSEEWTDREKF